MRATQFSYDTTRKLLATGASSANLASAVTIRNASANAVFIGGLTLAAGSSTNGFTIPAGATQSVDLNGGESIYITSAASGIVEVLIGGD